MWDEFCWMRNEISLSVVNDLDLLQSIENVYTATSYIGITNESTKIIFVEFKMH